MYALALVLAGKGLGGVDHALQRLRLVVVQKQRHRQQATARVHQ